MNGSSFECGTTRATAAAGTNWILSNERFKFWRCIISNNTTQHLAIEAEDKSPIGSTKPYRTFGNGFEDRLQIERRPTDDLKHIGGGSLLLKGFTQLVEESRVLDGDDGLRGKVLHQFNLLFREPPHLLAINHNAADQIGILEHWYGKHGTRAAQFGEVSQRLIAFKKALCDVVNLCDLPRCHDAAHRTFTPGRWLEKWRARTFLGKPFRNIVHRDRVTAVVFHQIQNTELGSANSYRIFQNCIEHGVKLTRRRANDLQDF